MIFSEFYDLVEMRDSRLKVKELSNTVNILAGRLFMNYSTHYVNGEMTVGFGEFIITDIRFDNVKSEILFDMEIYDGRKHNNLFKEQTFFDLLFERLLESLTLLEKIKLFKTKNPNKSGILMKLFNRFTFVNVWLNNVGAKGHNINFIYSMVPEIGYNSETYPYGNKWDKLIVPKNLSLLNENQDELIRKIILDIFESNLDLYNDPVYDTFMDEHNFDVLIEVAEEIELLQAEEEDTEETEDEDEA